MRREVVQVEILIEIFPFGTATAAFPLPFDDDLAHIFIEDQFFAFAAGRLAALGVLLLGVDGLRGMLVSTPRVKSGSNVRHGARLPGMWPCGRSNRRARRARFIVRLSSPQL